VKIKLKGLHRIDSCGEKNKRKDIGNEKLNVEMTNFKNEY